MPFYMKEGLKFSNLCLLGDILCILLSVSDSWSALTFLTTRKLPQ